jgi:hypothetical protein
LKALETFDLALLSCNVTSTSQCASMH